MGTAVLDAPLARPAPPIRVAPAAMRLVLRASLAVVILGLAVLAVGPRLYPFKAFYVRTGSMTPTLPVGALVIATVAHADELGRGDVILFERPDRPGTMVVHRIHAVEESPAGRTFITKGDANAVPDGWRLAAEGNGLRAVHAFSGLGFVVGWVQAAFGRQGWLGAFAIVCGVFALIWIWQQEEP